MKNEIEFGLGFKLRCLWLTGLGVYGVYGFEFKRFWIYGVKLPVAPKSYIFCRFYQLQRP